jgi:hypothetical protein
MGYVVINLHFHLCTVPNWIICQVFIVCYILIVSFNYVQSEYLLLTNSNPPGTRPSGQKDFKNDVSNDVTYSQVLLL